MCISRRKEQQHVFMQLSHSCESDNSSGGTMTQNDYDNSSVDDDSPSVGIHGT